MVVEGAREAEEVGGDEATAEVVVEEEAKDEAEEEAGGEETIAAGAEGLLRDVEMEEAQRGVERADEVSLRCLWIPAEKRGGFRQNWPL